MDPPRMIAMEDARPLTPSIRPSANWTEWEENSRSDNIVEEPYAEHRTRYTPDGRRDHVGDGRGDLDR